MRRPSAALLSGVLLLGLVQPARAADTLGRLFFTPQQRQDLDRRRQANVQESAATVNSSLTVNGQVSRSGGKSTVWINGVPQETRRPSDPARAVLPAGEGDSSSVNVKIGQTFDKTRGRVKDPIEGGQIVTPSERRAPKP